MLMLWKVNGNEVFLFNMMMSNTFLASAIRISQKQSKLLLLLFYLQSYERLSSPWRSLNDRKFFRQSHL